MGDYLPIFAAGKKPRTYTAGAAITGGQVVELSTADTVIPSAGAGGDVVGVAAHDIGSGGLVNVWPLPGVTHEVTASAAVAVGDNLAAAANGQVATIAQTAGTAVFSHVIGVAATAAGAGGVKIQMVGR
ncbi:capsid cement protein [Micromonospora globbae]|uniref:capsid cement protein n=1 Tax=Micromonospora globbae TaxID=1894969 RepID=UPI00344ABF6B